MEYLYGTGNVYSTFKEMSASYKDSAETLKMKYLSGVRVGAKGKVSTSKKETLEPQQKRLQTDFSVLRASSWPSCSRLLFYPFFFDIFYHRSAKCVNAFGLISM